MNTHILFCLVLVVAAAESAKLHVQQPAVANKIKKRNVVTPKDANEPCKDGDITSFDNNCNMCTCSNGLWACTLKFCL
ncbi:hypothetical protein D910_01887 [Dendroctonus ponderosae]